MLTQYETIEKNVELILNESLVAETIERLKINNELNSWVKEGLEIALKENLDVCPFCEQKYPLGLIERLEKHFSEEYNALIEKIELLVQEIQILKQNFNSPFPKTIEFYPEFSVEYDQIISDTQKELDESSIFIDYLFQCLSEKKKNPYKKIKLERDKPGQNLRNWIESVNNLIEKHNAKTEHFNESIINARSKIEEHLVAEKLGEYLQLNTLLVSDKKFG